MRASRAARMAPAIAASSWPPSRRSASSGSAGRSRWSATPAATTAVLRSSAAPADAGARSGPVGGGAAEQRVAEGGRRCRVGDAHLAERQHVDARLDRHHAVGHRARAFLLAHRRVLGEIAGRVVERHLVDSQVGVDRLAQLVHRGAAGDEILHHLRGHRGRIGRDAARRDAVIAGEHARCAGARSSAASGLARTRASRPAPRAGRARRPAWSARARACARCVPASRSGPGRWGSRARISANEAAGGLGILEFTIAKGFGARLALPWLRRRHGKRVFFRQDAYIRQ